MSWRLEMAINYSVSGMPIGPSFSNDSLTSEDLYNYKDSPIQGSAYIGGNTLQEPLFPSIYNKSTSKKLAGIGTATRGGNRKLTLTSGIHYIVLRQTADKTAYELEHSTRLRTNESGEISLYAGSNYFKITFPNANGQYHLKQFGAKLWIWACGAGGAGASGIDGGAGGGGGAASLFSNFYLPDRKILIINVGGNIEISSKEFINKQWVDSSKCLIGGAGDASGNNGGAGGSISGASFDSLFKTKWCKTASGGAGGSYGNSGSSSSISIMKNDYYWPDESSSDGTSKSYNGQGGNHGSGTMGNYGSGGGGCSILNGRGGNGGSDWGGSMNGSNGNYGSGGGGGAYSEETSSSGSGSGGDFGEIPEVGGGTTTTSTYGSGGSGGSSVVFMWWPELKENEVQSLAGG